MVVQRGFPAPPSYHIDRLRQAPTQHFYDVMTNGYGAMYSFAGRVSPQDRWAIAAYIRALQLVAASAGGWLCRHRDERGALCAWIVGGVGLVASLIGAIVQPEAFAFAWLAALTTWLRWPLGCLALLLVHA